MKPYSYRNCQSLFGYAAQVHVRSGGQCQLCLCGKQPVDFDLWRQMTVEHLIGKSQGGYLRQIREAIAIRFPHLSADEQSRVAEQIDAENTVSACSFCNSTTSRNVAQRSMSAILNETPGTAEEVMTHLRAELQRILAAKRKDVEWKLNSVRDAFEREVAPRFAERSAGSLPDGQQRVLVTSISGST